VLRRIDRRLFSPDVNRPDENGHNPKQIAMLQARELDLVVKLERCIPPVDKHRHDLERVRTKLALLSAAEG
jgi:hypothetical protein